MKKILVIDDDVEFIQDAKETLETGKYEVCSLYDFADDFDVEHTEPPDLIILEIMTFNNNKVKKFLQKIKTAITINNIPIIIVTDTDKEKFISSDFYVDIDWKCVRNTLNKPIKPSDLMLFVQYVLLKEKIAA